MLLDDSILQIQNIGKIKATQLAKLGIKTVRDLLFYFPRGHEDRSKTTTISSADIGESVNIRAKIVKPVVSVYLPNRKSMQKCVVSDCEGAELNITWFNQSYLPKTLKPDKEYIFYGKIEKMGKYSQMTSPKFTSAQNAEKATGILPLYPLTGKITHKMLQDAIRECMPCVGKVADLLPEEIVKQHSLTGLKFAIENIHFPLDIESFELARRRLVFEELFMLMLGLSIYKSANEDRKSCRLSAVSCQHFVDSLPYKLTNAQNKVIGEIENDLARDVPMARLLQGDVGSGKTVVAASACHITIQSGKNAVIMAPTEILAQQHYESFGKMFDDVVLIKGGMKAKEKRDILEGLTFGKPKVIIGTHALLQKSVEIPNIGLIVTDEQHRFGVRQREMLVGKSDDIIPHLLVMSATPIPRTLALILYGDLDISVLNEMPVGRLPIKTYAVDENYRERINTFIRKEVEAGRQAYIVCPLVEDSEVIEAKSVANYEGIEGIRTRTIHGKMKTEEKNAIMSAFAAGEIDVLISTTVIEVGINIPNASLMIIENAERFGLSQLHQLRGRVGRGECQSYCILFSDNDSAASKARAEVMVSTNDGFEIAERDLSLRGFGDFFGTRQHGLPSLKIANFYEDMDILAQAKEAIRVLDLSEHQELLSEARDMFIDGL